MDEAVHSVFAACVWHTQEMREQISSYGEPAYLVLIYVKLCGVNDTGASSKRVITHAVANTTK